MHTVTITENTNIILWSIQIRENHRQKEKAIKKFHEFVARTSNYMLLKAAKERQDLSIDASRVQNNYKSL